MTTLKQATDYYLDAHIGVHSDKTIKRRRRALSTLADFLGDPVAETVTLPDLRRLRAHELTRPNKLHPETTLSSHTVAGYVKDIKTFFRWIQAEGLIENNPAERLKLPRLDDMPPKAISMDNFTRMLAAVKKMGLNRPGGEILRARDRAILLFIADTGCRRMSATRLTTDQLDIDRRHAQVAVKGRLKTRSHTVFFSATTAQALVKWLTHKNELRPRPGNNHVFVALDVHYFGRPLKPNGITLLCYRLCAKAGINKYGPHSLRHAAARGWIQNGATLDQVSRLLGHASIEVTYLHYARWSNGELAEIHDKVSFIDNLNGGRNEAI